MFLSPTTLTCITIHRCPWPYQGFFFPSVLLSLVGHSKKILVLFVSVNTYTCDFILCFFPCLILIFFPMLPDSQDFLFLFYFIYFLFIFFIFFILFYFILYLFISLLYFQSYMYECITQSLVNTSQNCHFIHSFATSFNGQTLFTIFVIHYS